MKKETAGRPKAIIDWNKVSNLLKAQCEATGIAEILGITVDTLYNRCKTDNNLDFSVYCQQKKSEGKELLRAKLFQNAMQGNTSMQIWLSKQYLQMKEPKDLQEQVTTDAPINITIKVKE
jgi:hypothetical protein